MFDLNEYSSQIASIYHTRYNEIPKPTVKSNSTSGDEYWMPAFIAASQHLRSPSILMCIEAVGSVADGTRDSPVGCEYSE